MEELAYEQYLKESDGWLHRARRFLLGNLVEKIYAEKELPVSKKLKILEIGAGCGKSLDYLEKYGEFHAIEVEKIAIEILKKDKRITKLYEQHIPFDLDETYDLIVAMDVIEHIEDDQRAFDWIYDRLNSGGILFATVPAYQWMFSNHDVALNHFRRYSLKSFLSLNKKGMKAIFSSYFNCSLFPLAALSRLRNIVRNKKIGKQEKQSSRLPKLIDQIFYLILRVEVRMIKLGFSFPWGLSVAVALQKN